MFAEDEARLLASAAQDEAHLAAMVDRRVAGHPVEHVLGWAEFAGLRIAVEPGVFIPRRRTEFLLRQAATVLRSAIDATGRDGPRPVVVDVCCGSGAVAAALLAGMIAAPPGPEVYAVDIDPVAVRCARRNLASGGQVYQGDLYDALPLSMRGRVDVLVANAPYVPTTALELMPAEARVHEPRLALDGGPDGLDVLRRVVAGAPAWLCAGGALVVETSERQAGPAAQAFTRRGFTAEVAREEASDATVVVGTIAR